VSRIISGLLKIQGSESQKAFSDITALLRGYFYEQGDTTNDSFNALVSEATSTNFIEAIRTFYLKPSKEPDEAEPAEIQIDLPSRPQPFVKILDHLDRVTGWAQATQGRGEGAGARLASQVTGGDSDFFVQSQESQGGSKLFPGGQSTSSELHSFQEGMNEARKTQHLNNGKTPHPLSFLGMLGARLSLNNLAYAAQADERTLDLLAQAYRHASSHVKTGEKFPMLFEVGNALVNFRDENKRIFVDLSYRSVDRPREFDSAGFIDITERVKTVHPAAESAEKILELNKAVLEALAKTESIDLFALGEFAKVLTTDLTENTVVSIPADRDWLMNKPEGRACQELVERAIKGLGTIDTKFNLHVQFVSMDGKTVYEDVLNGSPGFESYKEFFVAPPTADLLRHAQSLKAGFLAHEAIPIGKAAMVPYKAVFITAILLSNSKRFDKEGSLNRILHRLLGKSVDQKQFEYLQTVPEEMTAELLIQQYKDLLIQIVPLTIDKFLEGARMALQTVGVAA
jgi:hypothetical protein